MANIKTTGFEIEGQIYEFIPPSPTETQRGGIIASPKTETDTVEVKLGLDGKLYVPEYASNNTNNEIPEHTHSFNDLTDKPFDEVVTYSDTLTWDGNTEGLEYHEELGYKVSDVVFTTFDVVNGTEVRGISETEYVTNNCSVSEISTGLVMLNGDYGMGSFLIFSISKVAEAELGVSSGTYFMYFSDNFRVSSLTINGYTGFKTKSETLKSSYLPDTVVTKSYLESYVNEAILGGEW